MGESPHVGSTFRSVRPRHWLRPPSVLVIRRLAVKPKPLSRHIEPREELDRQQAPEVPCSSTRAPTESPAAKVQATRPHSRALTHTVFPRRSGSYSVPSPPPGRDRRKRGSERRTEMGRIVVSDNVSLDGVIQDPAGDEGFERGGWVGLIKDRPGVSKLALDDALEAEALLLGRRTYEWFAGRWPSRNGELADRLNNMPKYVVSSTLHEPDWNDSTVLEGDAANEVADDGLTSECVPKRLTPSVRKSHGSLHWARRLPRPDSPSRRPPSPPTGVRLGRAGWEPPRCACGPQAPQRGSRGSRRRLHRCARPARPQPREQSEGPRRAKRRGSGASCRPPSRSTAEGDG